MKEELKLAFFNRRFVISFIVMLICFEGIAIPSWLDSAEWGELYRPSALEQTLGGLFFGGFMLLMPFCTTFPYAISQVDELRTGYFQYKVLRAGNVKYAVQKIIASMLGGASSITLAYTVNAVIWHLIALPYKPQTYSMQKIYFADSVIWHAWDEVFYALPIYLWVGSAIFVTSAIWAFFGLATAIWIPDKVLCTVVPVCVYHLWMGGFARYVFGVSIASPEALFNDGLTLEALKQSVSIYSGLLLVVGIAYMYGLKRRSTNA